MTAKRNDIIGHSRASDISDAEQPAWLRQRLEWLMDQRFGCILHWGPYSQWDCCESWPLVPADSWARPDNLNCWIERDRDLARFSRDYRALNRTFNPTDFDPDAWAATLADAGMRYVALTTKHHDGFCLYDTRTTDYRITHPDCPFHNNPRADIVKAAFDAFRGRGLAISCYFSKSDWNSPDYWAPDFPVRDRNPNYDTHAHPDRWERFVKFTHRQIAELMTGYGKIDILWLDGGQVRPPDQDIRMAEIAAMARRHQPGLIFADRTVGGRYEDFITPEQEIPEQPMSVPWESCITLGHAWKYVSDDHYKSAAAVVRMLAETTAKGGNLLLGVGPDPQGRIPTEATVRLKAIGAWLRVNGEAIYATRPLPPFQSGAIRFTRKADIGYAIALEPVGNVKGNQLQIQGLQPLDATPVHLLGYPTPLTWHRDDLGFQVKLPTDFPAGNNPIVVKFRLA